MITYTNSVLHAEKVIPNSLWAGGIVLSFTKILEQLLNIKLF